MEHVKPEDIAFSEPDGAISINAVAVADRLNEILLRVERLEVAMTKGQILSSEEGVRVIIERANALMGKEPS